MIILDSKNTLAYIDKSLYKRHSAVLLGTLRVPFIYRSSAGENLLYPYSPPDSQGWHPGVIKSQGKGEMLLDGRTMRTGRGHPGSGSKPLSTFSFPARAIVLATFCF